MGDIIARGLAKKIAINPNLYQTPYDAIIANPDTDLFMCIGDSLTAIGIGYIYFIKNTLVNSGYDVEVNRLAVSGYRIGDMYTYVKNNLSTFPNAKVFTILLGTNDTKTSNGNTWFSRSNSKFYYTKMIECLKEQRPSCDIRIVQIPWIRADTTDDTFLPHVTWLENKDGINQIIRSIARKYGMPEAPDLYSTTEGMDDYYIYDGLHFSEYGQKHIAPTFVNLIKQIPTYTADRDFLTGRDYTITGATISGAYPDWVGNASTNYMKKLTNGAFYTLDSDLSLSQQIGYLMNDNGGDGATVNVEVSFDFNEDVVLNDVSFYTGNFNSPLYSAKKISIYSFDGTDYFLEGEITPEIENPYYSILGFFNSYTPDKPFATRGLKIIYEHTFIQVGGDWFIIGEIAATRLQNYS